MNERNYEGPKIEVIPMGEEDVITTSDPFDGEDDYASEWGS